MTVVFVLPVSGQPRYWKRIDALTGEGAEATVLTFDRPYVKAGHDHEGRAEVIGSMKHGKYLQRLAALTRAIAPIYRRTREADFLYCFGTDLAVLGVVVRVFRRRLQLVVEIGDVRPVMVEDGLKGIVLRAVERLALRHAAVIVVTSPAYRDRYLLDPQGATAGKILVAENKVDPRVRELAEPIRGDDVTPGSVLSIGYYGLIRCRKSWSLLARIAQTLPDRFRVDVWGRLILDHSWTDLQVLPPNMAYHGEFRNPDDLSTMFRRFDLVWVAHAHGTTNTDWARANRFYEACCFGKPMIGQRGTLDGGEIDRLDMGFCIDLNDADEALDRIASITARDVSSWRSHVLALDEAVYQYGGEHAELAQRMRQARMPPMAVAK